MNDTDSRTRFTDYLDRHLANARELREHLQAETTVLRAGNAGGVEQLLAAKQAALLRFETLDREREQILAQAGCGTRPEAIRDWVMDCGEAVAVRWRGLLALAMECRQQNQLNGALIQAGLRHTRQVLNLLSGRPPEENASYAPAPAVKSAAAPGCSLGKA
jgi:flagella synthesis protein FlgN